MTGDLSGVQLHFVNSVEDARRFMSWLGERRPVLAVDTETEGLEWWHEKVRLIQLGDADAGWAIPWDLWGGVALEALRAYDGPMVMHNAKFDVHMIEHWTGLELPRHQLHDTRVMGHILDPNRATGLKHLASVFVDAKSANASRVLDEAMSTNGWTWATVPVDFEMYWGYGALDTVLTARLYDVLQPQVMDTAPRAYDLEMATTWVLERMERNGMRLDRSWTEEKRDTFASYVESSGRWCEETYGVKPGSNQAVIKQLQADGVEFSKLTRSGNSYALDKTVLEEIIEATKHPLAETVLQRRRLEKLVSTYFDNFLRLDFNGRVHPSFNSLKTDNSGYGARTGRMSVTEPALQTLPRLNNSSPQAIAVRNCITATDEDHTLVMCDFDQIEARMEAHFAGDAGLMSAFGEGDFFTNMARRIFHDPELVKADPRRQRTKNGFYAKIYGAGPAKFAETAGIPESEGHTFMQSLDDAYPGIKLFERAVAQAAGARLESDGAAYVKSPLTGRRHVADPGREYTLVNYLIQGTAAEVLKMKNVELAAADLSQFMILNVHDEVILDVPNDILDDVATTVHDVMNDTELFSVPLTAGISTSYRWGEATK